MEENRDYYAEFEKMLPGIIGGVLVGAVLGALAYRFAKPETLTFLSAKHEDIVKMAEDINSFMAWDKSKVILTQRPS